ncbi:MAG: transcription elongation factor GreA [Chloroflexi bacterium]|nr:transcription elongation factor GreA [Chloroflexota bacterium]
MTQVSESLTVLEAVGVYAGSLRPKDGVQTESHKQLLRFVSWCGAGRKISELAPSEIGEYSDQSSGGTQSAERLQEVKKFLAFASKQGLTEQNLARHLRIRKARSRAKLSGEDERRASLIELTPEGHKDLVAELEDLKAQRGPIAAQIRSAAADKDVRENVPLEAAREHLGQVESRILEIENTLTAAVVVDPSARKKSTVQVGSRVWLKDLSSGRENQYTVVSASEAKPLEGKVSDESPVGKAVIRRREGDEVDVQTPRGMVVTYSILKVA